MYRLFFAFTKQLFITVLVTTLFFVIIFSNNHRLFAQSSETRLNVTVFIHGIGKGGDAASNNAAGNMQPGHTERLISLEVVDANDSIQVTKEDPLTFNTLDGSFQGVIGLGTPLSGATIVKVKMPQTLRKIIPGIVTLQAGQQANLPTVYLVNGDMNDDNRISILDYNLLLDCFSDLSPAKNCADVNKKLMTDINDDGRVNQFDYNLLLREISVQEGDPGGGGQPTPTGSIVPTHTTGNSTTSMAFGKWMPGRFDTCTKEQHDSFFVIGPDGKKYPTWHPPLGPGGCKFGHEHGRDPAGYQYWSEIREHFAFDADHNGTINTTELASAGLPFGYVNEQIDAYFAARSTGTFMRHEDHVGHKVEFGNGEADAGTDPFDSSATGGMVVPVKSSIQGRKWDPSGVRCYHFHKVHQGVSTPDALTNNIHEIIMHQKCTSTRNDFPTSTSLLSGMMAFGAPGEFNRFCGNGDRTQIVRLGTTTANQHFPGSSNEGSRAIITRDCVEQTVLVPPGQFSSFPYEIWSGDLKITTANGRRIASNNGGWEVLDAIRYYNPGSVNKISYTATWCYETLGDRRARGGTCDDMTDFGRITDITFDDPRSEYRGVHRGQYVEAHRLHNNGGSQYWYSDPFGENAQNTPFPGSIRQLISPVEADLIGKAATDPRIIQHRHDSGSRSVHAPN